MKDTSIVPMKIPEHAKLLAPAHETKQNFSTEYDAKTGTWIRWITGLQTGTAGSAVLVNLPAEGFLIAGNIGFGVTGFALIIAWLGTMMEHKSVKSFIKGVKGIKEVPNYGEWESSSLTKTKYNVWENETISTRGYRVRKSSAKSFTLQLFNPKRAVGGAVLSETLWYNPVTDIYTLETENIRMLDMFTTVEQYAGRRKTLSDALKAL